MKYKSKKKTITISAIAIALAVCAVFALVAANTRDSIFGTPLSIRLAPDGATVDSSYLPFTGNARHARTVLVNGRSIALDRDGNFNDALILSPGYNAVEVALRDQFGKESVHTYHLVFKPVDTLARSGATTPSAY